MHAVRPTDDSSNMVTTHNESIKTKRQTDRTAHTTTQAGHQEARKLDYEITEPPRDETRPDIRTISESDRTNHRLARAASSRHPPFHRPPTMIHFVRHAEAVSNAAAHKYPQGSPARNEEYQKQEYFNAALSGKGKLQAADLAGHLARLMKDSELGEGGPRQNFLVVSTLQRTLDTASIGLAGREQSFTWIASDSIREWAEGESHPCDYRGSLKEDDVSSRYPWIDFSACEDEDPIKPDESS